jgi:hypothetical protein
LHYELQLQSRLLQQNFPSPFNTSTVLEYMVTKRAHAMISVYNILDQRVCTLLDEIRNLGEYSVTWNGQDDI